MFLYAPWQRGQNAANIENQARYLNYCAGFESELSVLKVTLRNPLKVEIMIDKIEIINCHPDMLVMQEAYTLEQNSTSEIHIQVCFMNPGSYQIKGLRLY